MPPTDAPTHDQVERQITGAFSQVEKLMDARMGEIHAELRGIRRELEGFGAMEADLEDLKTRVHVLEAFHHAQEKRLGESRAYRKIHLPTIAIATVAVLVAILALLL